MKKEELKKGMTVYRAYFVMDHRTDDASDRMIVEKLTVTKAGDIAYEVTGKHSRQGGHYLTNRLLLRSLQPTDIEAVQYLRDDTVGKLEQERKSLHRLEKETSDRLTTIDIWKREHA